MNGVSLFSIPPKRGAAYVRHSDERQENSAEIQLNAIKEFARRHNIEIIREFVDRGISGLTEKRPAFLELMEFVKNPDSPEFQYVLVFDISRFGRFIDLDKSAALEYACKSHGKELVAVVRGLPTKDQQLAHHLMRSIDRYMSAEFVQMLSLRVKGGCIKVAQQGFSSGGCPPYGLERLLLDEQHRPVQILRSGEQKMISNQRVTFVPSEGERGKIVLRIFDEFVIRGRTPFDIAEGLNRDRLPSPGRRRWRASMTRRILSNSSYLGCLIYNKTSGPLKSPRRINPKATWIVVPNAFPALVPSELFERAQEILRANGDLSAKEPLRTLKCFSHFVTSRLVSDRPLVLASLPSKKGDLVYWCFRLPGGPLKQRDVLCVGLAAENRFEKTYLPGNESFFLVPGDRFGVSRYVICEKGHSSFQIDEATAERYLKEEVAA